MKKYYVCMPSVANLSEEEFNTVLENAKSYIDMFHNKWLKNVIEELEQSGKECDFSNEDFSNIINYKIVNSIDDCKDLDINKINDKLKAISLISQNILDCDYMFVVDSFYDRTHTNPDLRCLTEYSLVNCNNYLFVRYDINKNDKIRVYNIPSEMVYSSKYLENVYNTNRNVTWAEGDELDCMPDEAE